MIWELLIILLLILANGFFAGAEIAIIASRKGRLQQLAEEGDRRARLALELAANPNRFLPTVQVGITLFGTISAAFAGDRVVGALAARIETVPAPLISANASKIAFVIVVLVLTFMSLILGELVPKRLSLQNAEVVARLVSPIMNAVATVGRPAVWVMGAATNAVLFLLRAHKNVEPSVSVDDIEHMITAGTAEGVLDQVEQKLAMEALRLGDRTVRDIMRPRIDLDALDVTTPPGEVIGAVAMAGFSRLPVYESDLDHIIGFVHIKDLFRQQYLGWPIQLRKLLHPAVFVPESMTLDRLLQQLQESRTQLAIVLDEYGGTQGMVTLDDVMEELVGEMRDEHHADRQQDFVQRDENSWLIDGGFSIADLLERLDIREKGEPVERNFSTISGLILDQLGRIPSIGDTTTWKGLTLEVVDMDGQRIDRVLLTAPPQPPPQKSTPAEGPPPPSS